MCVYENLSSVAPSACVRVVLVVRRGGPPYRDPLHPAVESKESSGLIKPAGAPRWVSSSHPHPVISLYPRLNTLLLYFCTCAVAAGCDD